VDSDVPSVLNCQVVFVCMDMLGWADGNSAGTDFNGLLGFLLGWNGMNGG